MKRTTSNSGKSRTHRFGRAAALVAGITCVVCIGNQAAAQSALPLVQQSDITYLGGFALPPGIFGKSDFAYGGHGLSFYKDSQARRTLFMQGHPYNPGSIAQVQIPSSYVISSNWDNLPKATVMQSFADITDGKIGSVDPSSSGSPTNVYGILAYNNRLILGASNVYSFGQTVSHGVSNSLTISGGTFSGWYSMNSTAPPRAVGGTMALVPPEWRTALGGVALTGQFGLSVVSTTSAGPTATVFNPDAVGVSSPIPGKTLLYYPIEHPACGALHCEATQNNIFNLSTGYGGMAFPAGSRSLLFITAHGTGPYCYGTAIECNDPAMSDVKGPHAPPYRYQILAYDVNDLMAVKNGTKQSYEPVPYGVFVLNGMPNSGNAFIKGATYDPDTGHLFITQDYGTKSRVEVYEIKVSGSTIQPKPPSNVNAQ